MAQRTRTFTRNQLDAIGVPHDLPTNPAHAPEGAAVELHCEQVDSRRWVSVHHLIFRAPDDGKAYRVAYQQGLTEHQDGIDPWFYDDEIKGVEVEPRQVTVTRWMPVETARPLPHDPYITAVTDALAAADLTPDDYWTSDAETNPYDDGPDAGCARMLNAVIRWDDDGSRDGLILLWDHPAEQWQYAWLWPDGRNREPEFLPTLGRYADPAAIVEAVRSLLAGEPLPEGHAPYWHPADAAKAAVAEWEAAEART